MKRPFPAQTHRLAQQIRAAADYLVHRRGYTLAELNEIIDPGNERGQQLHKNSLMKIKDLRWTYTVPRRQGDGDFRWVEAPEGSLGDPDENHPKGRPGRHQWLWNPQVVTLANLERLVDAAKGEGWNPDRKKRKVRRRPSPLRGSLHDPVGVPAQL